MITTDTYIPIEQPTEVVEWKDISGYEGLYQVSSDGQVKSYDLKVKYPTGTVRIQKGRVLKPGNQSGYCRVNLAKDGKIYPWLIHRLVAITFIPNPENKREVNHIDFDRRNNNIENLEWVTPSENCLHNIKHGRNLGPTKNFHNKHGKDASRYNDRPVIQMNDDEIEIARFPSVTDAVLAMGGKRESSNITAAIRVNTRSYGFKWKYA